MRMSIPTIPLAKFDAMTASEPRRQAMPVVALGLSAIDMLCCALVSGLVMFLVLSSPRAPAPFEGGLKGDSYGLSIRYVLETDGPVMVLRFVEDGVMGPHPTFYGDTARPLRFITDHARRSSLVLPEGTIQEDKRTVSSPDGSLVRDAYTYIVLQMRPVRWRVLLTYADTSREMASAIPATATATVDVQGRCAVTLECRVEPGGSASLESGTQCTQKSDSSCSVSAILDEIARRKSGGK